MEPMLRLKALLQPTEIDVALDAAFPRLLEIPEKMDAVGFVDSLITLWLDIAWY